MKKLIYFAVIVALAGCSGDQKRISELEAEVQELKIQLDSVSRLAEEQKFQAEEARDHAIRAFYEIDSVKAAAFLIREKYLKLKQQYEQ